jgi:hypothetical protein
METQQKKRETDVKFAITEWDSADALCEGPAHEKRRREKAYQEAPPRADLRPVLTPSPLLLIGQSH